MGSAFWITVAARDKGKTVDVRISTFFRMGTALWMTVTARDEVETVGLRFGKEKS